MRGAAFGVDLLLGEAEGGGEEIGKGTSVVTACAGRLGTGAFRAGVEDEDQGWVGRELEQGLAAGAAGHGGGLVKVGNGDGGDLEGGAEAGDGRGDGGLFGAGGEAEACVFDVAASDDSAGLCPPEQKGGADAKAAVGGVGVFRGSAGKIAQVLGEVSSKRGFGRHAAMRLRVRRWAGK